MSRQFVPASQFTVQELTDAYNQTRVDYLVPMPLNAARLTDYINIYDIDMDRSVVAMAGDQILGINMLGVRDGRSWVTRLGVLPVKRRAGTGQGMMDYLLARSTELEHPRAILEVIKDNNPAHQLFLKCGFYETRELTILRRAPNGEMPARAGDFEWLPQDEAIATLRTYPKPLAWTSQPETYLHTDDTLGITCELPEGDRGWLVFRVQKFYLTHFIIHTTQGDPVRVARALLTQLHREPDYEFLDTHTENLEVDDPHLPAFWEHGYFEVFRRIEMYRDQ
jgi:ribosomal protein S18 acetylase RimI-like enzyme